MSGTKNETRFVLISNQVLSNDFSFPTFPLFLYYISFLSFLFLPQDSLCFMTPSIHPESTLWSFFLSSLPALSPFENSTLKNWALRECDFQVTLDHHLKICSLHSLCNDRYHEMDLEREEADEKWIQLFFVFFCCSLTWNVIRE